jgi:hypothetical protein
MVERKKKRRSEKKVLRLRKMNEREMDKKD